MSRRLVTALVRTLLLSLLAPLSLFAQPPAAAQPDVRVLIDVSGSMRQTDPRNLRRPGLELLLQLMPRGAQAGVWTFGHQVKVLVPHGEATPAWRKAAQPKAAQIGSNELFTDIPAALEAASAGLQPGPGTRPSIILLTDGVVDISKNPAENAAARKRLLEQLLPKLRASGVQIHAVALSKSADLELLERLAVDTGGLFAVAETAEELNQVFLRAFDAAAPAEQVPLKGNRFEIDGSIDELTALVFHAGKAPLELLSPDGHRISAAKRGDDVRWFVGKGYDLITIQKPLSGEWSIDTELQPGSRVTIVSDLSLTTERLPTNLFVGGEMAMAAALMEQGELLQRPELLKLVTFAATVSRRDDFRQWQVPLTDSGDGYYRAALPMLAEAGSYDVTVAVDGKTFERSQRQELAVRDSFELQLQKGEGEPASHRIVLFARNPEVDGAASTVSATIVGPDGEQQQPVTSADGREWQVELTPQSEGQYRVSFAVDGRYRSGAAFSYSSAVVSVDASGKASVEGEAAPPQPLAAEEPAPEPAAETEEVAAAEEQPSAEAPAKAEGGWKRWALYGGLALGNLLLIGLGYFAYRMIMGGNKSSVLETPDEEDDASPADGKADAKASKKKAAGKAPPSLDDLELPLDAIDIDPAADSKKK